MTDEARKMVQQQLEGDQTMESISSWPDQYCHTPEGWFWGEEGGEGEGGGGESKKDGTTTT